MKKIYFACSISGGRDQAHVYQDIIAFIKSAGGEVLSELFADPKLVSEIGTDPKNTSHFIWDRDCAWVKAADGLVAEVTQPSLGVGYEIAKAEEWGIPVLALFNSTSGKRLSPMINGSPKVAVCEYTDAPEIKAALIAFLGNLT